VHHCSLHTCVISTLVSPRSSSVITLAHRPASSSLRIGTHHPVSGINSQTHFVNQIQATLVYTESIPHMPDSSSSPPTPYHSVTFPPQAQNLSTTPFPPQTPGIIWTAFTGILVEPVLSAQRFFVVSLFLFSFAKLVSCHL